MTERKKTLFKPADAREMISFAIFLPCALVIVVAPLYITGVIAQYINGNPDCFSFGVFRILFFLPESFQGFLRAGALGSAALAGSPAWLLVEAAASAGALYVVHAARSAGSVERLKNLTCVFFVFLSAAWLNFFLLFLAIVTAT